MIENMDALGNPIIMGNRYGYSTSRNGFSRTTVGVAIKNPSDGKTSLKPVLIKRALYNDMPKEISLPRSVTCKSMILFPIFESLLSFYI